MAAQTNNFLNSYSQLLDTLIQDALIRSAWKDPEAYEQYMAEMIEDYPEVLAVYMSTPDNVYMDSTFWTPGSDFIPTKRDWYTTASETDRTIYLSPYMDAQTGKYVISIARRVENYGVLSLDLTIDQLTSFITSTAASDGSYSFLVEENGNIIAHPQELFKPQGDTFKNLITDFNGIYKPILESTEQLEYGTQVITLKDIEKQKHMYVKTKIPSTGWLVVSSISTNAMEQEILLGILKGLPLPVISIIFLILVILIFANYYFRPIVKVSDVLEQIASGNLKADYQHIEKNSYEIHKLLNSLQKMTTSIHMYVHEIGHVTDEIASGNFNVNTSQEFIGDYHAIEVSLSKLNEDISDTLKKITSHADEVAAISEVVADSAQSITLGANEQVASISDLTSSINTIAEQVDKTASNSVNANDLSLQSTEMMEHCNQRMQELLSAMREVEVSSDQISKIIKTIEDIAFQTNILALNAAVEAKHAGAAGSGFSVVAEEVRNLASKSTAAAKDTAALIESSMKAVANSVQLAEKTAGEMIKTVDQVHSINVIVTDITKSTTAQSKALNPIAQKMEQISAVVNTNLSTSEESSKASEELANQAKTLKSFLSKFTYKNI